MYKIHSLLKRQLKKYFDENFAPDLRLKDFIESVDSAYKEFDSDRAMLERALEFARLFVFNETQSSELLPILESFIAYPTIDKLVFSAEASIEKGMHNVP